MKRRTRFLLLTSALVGAFPLSAAVSTASATPLDSAFQHRVVVPVHDAPPRARPAHPAVVRHAPLVQRITVAPGDTLTAIGARSKRTWGQLASYNKIANPNFIYPGQILTVPPVSYQPAAITPPVSAPEAVAQVRSTSSAPRPSAAISGGVWGCIGAHESGNNARENTGNGYEGAFQFAPSTWASLGTGYAHAYDAPYSVQLNAAMKLQQRAGWGQWPNTSRECGA
jgi:transglycosylase-like protein/LysM domain-containing protein